MKKLVWAILTFFAICILFVPSSSGGGIRNVPLLICIACCIAILLMYRFIYRIYVIFKIRKTAISACAYNIKCSYIPNFFRIPGKYDVTFDLHGKKHNIVVLMIHNTKVRHYLKNENVIERYVASRMSFAGKTNGRISQQVNWNEKSKLSLPWKNLRAEDVNVLVLNKFPTEIADANSRTTTLGNGDVIFSKIHLFDIKHFIPYLKSKKKSDS